MSTTNININQSGSRSGSGRDKQLKSCRACNGTGWADGPVQMKKCIPCHGTGYVRV